MIIRNLKVLDANAVANLHRVAFKNFFLTKLGSKFLSAFYKSIFESENSISVGLFEGETLVGFAVGAKNRKSFYYDILKSNFLTLGWYALIPLFSNPLYFYRLYISLISSNSINGSIEDDATLLSICIENSSGSAGHGSLLLAKFEELAFQYSDLISLTTDADNNSYVNSFYIKKGYTIVKVFYQGKRRMNLYLKQKF